MPRCKKERKRNYDKVKHLSQKKKKEKKKVTKLCSQFSLERDCITPSMCEMVQSRERKVEQKGMTLAEGSEGGGARGVG